MNVKGLNIEALRALPQDEPVVMVNLMRFRERALDGNGSGWDAYLRYSKATAPLIKARGGTIIWAGTANATAVGDADAHRWDYVALVYYPTRAAFLDMMTCQPYETVSEPLRVAACAEHVILATTEAYSKMLPSTRG
jgi:uncharacterized protein (DUF1330 family)